MGSSLHSLLGVILSFSCCFLGGKRAFQKGKLRPRDGKYFLLSPGVHRWDRSQQSRCAGPVPLRVRLA